MVGVGEHGVMDLHDEAGGDVFGVEGQDLQDGLAGGGDAASVVFVGPVNAVGAGLQVGLVVESWDPWFATAEVGELGGDAEVQHWRGYLLDVTYRGAGLQARHTAPPYFRYARRSAGMFAGTFAGKNAEIFACCNEGIFVLLLPGVGGGL